VKGLWKWEGGALSHLIVDLDAPGRNIWWKAYTSL